MQRERLAGVDGELKEKLERRLERCDELRQRRPEAPELHMADTRARMRPGACGAREGHERDGCGTKTTLLVALVLFFGGDSLWGLQLNRPETLGGPKVWD